KAIELISQNESSDSSQLAHVHRELALRLSTMDRHQEAAQAHRKAKDIFQKLAAQMPGDPYLRYVLAYTNFDLGSLLAAHNQRQEGEQLWREAIDSFAKLTGEFPERFEYRQAWRRGRELANHLKASGRPKEAEEVLRDMIQFSARLVAANPKVA